MRYNLTSHIIKLLTAILLFFSAGDYYLLSQEVIDGVINRYAKVNTIGAGYVICTPAQITQYAAGDYVLLIQMQGVGIQTTQGAYGVNVQSQFGKPGGYEFLIIQAVNYGTGRIDFTRNVYLNTYNVTGNVQLIKVPFYNSPTVTGTLGSQVWNSSAGTGGVLAMLVSRKLTLNADIDVSGQGFVGAQGVSGIGECVNINEIANNHDSYPLTWNNAGLKGEGVAIHDQFGALLYPNYAKGQGRNFSGGGGGNGRFSGGGGGSNRGKGADGGLENAMQCSNDPRDGGFGGMNIMGTIIQDGIFAGGGGGASTQADGSSASAGGNGGGIIIIIADSIDGNNHFIRSNGISASNPVSNAGAGGGGAGGSIAISFRGISDQTRISSNGGNGGSNPGGFGEGGGGGGGLIWLGSSSVPALITSSTVAFGTPAPTIPSEGTGEIKFNYFPGLNGFLFNSIWSAATGTRIDSVCSNVMYGLITGTRPVGGTTPYTFQWQVSITSATSGFIAAPGVNNLQDYTPPALLTQTAWFRRVVTDNSPSTITDISLPVMVEVHPYIRNNVIGDPDTLCYGQNASLLGSRQTLLDGNGIYTFNWQSSTDNVSFSNTSSTTESYLPASGLTQTTWYRRIVNSGSCVNTSAAIRINVLEPVSNNSLLTPPQEICEGMLFSNLQGTIAPVLSGGDNSYRYLWESSTNGSVWITATGTVTGAGYDPVESSPAFPGQQYFRRIVYSGSNNVCVSISEPVLLNQYPFITNNSILSGNQTICSGDVPLELTGSIPLNGKGAGTYTFTWQDSTKNHSWADIPGFTGVTSVNFTPSALADTTRFRRIAYSSLCSNISRSISIFVHKPITANNISLLAGGLADTTLCSGSVPHSFTGTIPQGGTNNTLDFSYQWSSSPDNSAWTNISASGTGRYYQPGALTGTTYFRRRATSGECFTESNPVKITILPLISNNTVAGNQTVCKDNSPSLLEQAPGANLSGGAGTGSYFYFWEESPDGSAWNPASGTNNSSNGSYQPPLMTRTMKYRRNVISGPGSCCSSISNVLELVIDSLPPGSTINAGSDTTIFSFDHIIQMAAEPPIPGGTGKWTTVEGTGSFEDDTDKSTRITGLAMGLNRFLWTVTKGACKMEDMVDVMVYELFIPEGFSPNDDPDGYNNTFIIKGLDLPNQEAELTVINSAGTVVFSTSNRNGSEWLDWNGKNSKGIDMPEGTYYYLLKIVSKENSQIFKKSGFIVLKRY